MPLSSVTAFCPGHISGYFLPLIQSDPECSGSIGAGLVISEGVRVTAQKADISSVKVYQTDRTGMPVLIEEDSLLIRDLLNQMGVNAAIQTCCHLPIGSGYGMSAAALLGSVHALNILYQLNLSDQECALMAHRVEVMHRSGLGDVAACQGGGFVVRETPGPSGIIHRMMDIKPIFALTLSPIKTASILNSPEWLEKVTKAFPAKIPENIDEFMVLSRTFAEESGLITEDVRVVLTACDTQHIPASMTMLGRGVFAIGRRAGAILKEFGTVYRFSLSPGGPRILQGERVL